MSKKEFAPGIPRQEYLGDLSKLKERQLLDYVIQQHFAKRRGFHRDFRLGDKSKGMYSWAMNQDLPQQEGDKHWVARTNLHTHKYKDFEGTIPKGSYGAGEVRKQEEGKALVTHTTPDTISFSTADKKHPSRYSLVHPGDKYGKNQWLMMKQKTPDYAGAEKQHYKNIPEDKILDYLKSIQEGTSVQPKLDGALQFINLTNKKIEMLSHRTSKTTGKPVVHTERFFGYRPHLDIPSEYNNSVLLGETYGSKDDKPISPQETGGLLNSSIENSLGTQKEKGIQLKNMLFDIAKLKGKDVQSSMPYDEKREILKKIIKLMPKGKFHLPEEASTPQDATALWHKIKDQQHEHTSEGIVVRPQTGTPLKTKIFPEQDVHIRGFFPGEGKYKDKGVGGFEYSHQPNSDIVGRVGTGLTDETRQLMYSDPKSFLGRIAKVHSQGQLPSGALRVPAYLGLHEDY